MNVTTCDDKSTADGSRHDCSRTEGHEGEWHHCRYCGRDWRPDGAGIEFAPDPGD